MTNKINLTSVLGGTSAVLLFLLFMAAQVSTVDASGPGPASLAEEDPIYSDSELKPIRVVKGYICSGDQPSWLVDPLGVAFCAKTATVNGKPLSEQGFGTLSLSYEWHGTDLDLVIVRDAADISAALAKYETRIRIANEGTGMSASGVVAYSYDGTTPGGTPPQGVLRDLTGRILITSTEWGEGATVCLTLHLLGFRGDTPEWIQGRVIIR